MNITPCAIYQSNTKAHFQQMKLTRGINPTLDCCSANGNVMINMDDTYEHGQT